MPEEASYSERVVVRQRLAASSRGRSVKLNILQKFTLLSVAVTLLIVVGLSVLVSRLLAEWLVSHEARITAASVETITRIDLTQGIFRRVSERGSYDYFEYIWEHLQTIPEVFRVKMYDAEGTIVWSDEEELIGKKYEENEELKEALGGRTVVEFGEEKEEHEYETESVPKGQLLEIYVPLISQRDGAVYGALEIYKHPEEFLRTRRELLPLIWLGSIGGGLVLFLSLFWLFRGALLEQQKLQEVERRYAEIEFELSVAGDIQRRLLPLDLPEIPGIELAGYHFPSREIGGDYFDAFRSPRGDLVFIVADSEGKGIPGALVMVETRQILRMRADVEAGASEIVSSVNDYLAAAKGPNRILTMFLAKLNLDTHDLAFCNAGHCPALLLRGSELLTFDVGGVPAGLMEGAAYEQGETRLLPGDLLFLHTDGVTEAANSDEELFGAQRLRDLLRGLSGNESAEEVVELVNQAVDAFIGDEPLRDDTTMLCMRVEGAAEA